MNNSVLIIEDEVSLATILSYDLKKSGYNTTIISDGKAAQELIPVTLFDFYIIDWMLPFVNGIELISLIRHYNPSAYIVMASAKDDELSRVEGLETGADHSLKVKSQPPMKLQIVMNSLMMP